MASKQLELALVLALKDNGTGRLSKSLTEVSERANKLAKEAESVEKKFDGVSKAVENAAEAGRILGSRPIPQGFLQYIRQVTREANLAERAVKGIGNGLGKGLQVGGALKAGQMVLAEPVRKAVDYDTTLTHMANTAFSDKGTAERLAGKSFLNNAVIAAVRAGGGTREGAAATMDSLIARNAIGSPQDVAKLMPSIMVAASAGQADPVEIGKIVSTAVKTGGIKVDEIPDILGGALYAGQQGGFELKDMAKWLPEQMAMAKKAGLTGKGGMAKLLALNEMAIDAAGSTDAAGNNVRDFLHELNATNTANHLKRFSIDKKTGNIVEKHGRKQGGDYIDLGATLASNQEKGISADETMLSIVRKIAESSPQFQAVKQRYLKAKAAGDKTGAVENSEAAYNILLGAGVGKIFHNQQALLGGIGAIMDPEAYRKMAEQFRGNMSSAPIDQNMATLQQSPGFKLQQMENERTFSQQATLDKVTPALGAFADASTSLYQKYPGFGMAIEGSTLALKALAAAAGSAALIGVLTGRIPIGGAVAAGAAGEAAAGAGAAANAAGAGSMLTKGASVLGKVFRVGGAFALGYQAGGYINDGINWGISKATGQEGNTLGSWLYDVTHKGEADKLLASTPLSSAAARVPDSTLFDGMRAQQQSLQQTAQTLSQLADRPIVVQSTLMLDGRVLAEATNQTNSRDASRH
ncbi:phage tail tape measure protein [Ralstonia pseudosolanacearum]|uniref:phage tail tape measure protein n=1 Tax=Ralstonia pseudosolanacearum TaxID=1310165 RepID=UPI0008D9B9DD|nr:phage tail tape measure protein [Ralstonia pseudosolanacearum]MCL1618332.1 phage tail tape measure protein [Ralstonia pseudosolanacearum CaRs-Mep]